MGRLASHRLLRRIQLGGELQRLLAECSVSEVLCDEDTRRLALHLRSLFTLIQGLYAKREELDASVWNQVSRILTWLVLTPGVVGWWNAHLDSFDADFARAVEGIRAASLADAA